MSKTVETFIIYYFAFCWGLVALVVGVLFSPFLVYEGLKELLNR